MIVSFSVKFEIQRIVLELWIRPFHFSSIMISFSDGTGAPMSFGATGRTGSGFPFFFLGYSSSTGSSSSGSSTSSPSSFIIFFFYATTTGSGFGGGGWSGASASSSASMLNSVNRRSGWFVADQMLTCPSTHLVAKYLFFSLLSETIYDIGSPCASWKISSWFLLVSP
jgi:hypothetical protein